MLYFYLKMHQNACQDLLEELTALPLTPSWIKGEGREGGSGNREGKEE